jgi:hypothetical protein
MRFQRSPILWSILIISGGLLAATGALASAQGRGDTWTPAVNISQSGTASDPVIAVAPDGELHALWWDSLDGEKYAHTTLTSTTWTQPVNVPEIVGLREENPQTKRVTLTPPHAVTLVATADNSVQALWLNEANELLQARLSGNVWSKATILAEAVTIFNTSLNPQGNLQVAYIQSAAQADTPAGVYYQLDAAGRWSERSLVHASSYFRAAQPALLNLSVAGNDRQQTMVVWDEPQLPYSQLAISQNAGTGWSAPLPLSNTQSSPVRGVSIAAAPNGDFLMLWQDTGTSNECTYAQRVSSDGGETWTAPARIFKTTTLCQQTLTFASDADGRLWLIGHAASTAARDNSRSVTFAVWDGQTWSQPIASTLSAPGSTGRQQIPLSCLTAAIAGQSAGIIGCDTNQDVFAARNAAALSEITDATLQPAWSGPKVISDQGNPNPITGLADVSADQQGNLYVVWSQGTASSRADTALYGEILSGGQWSDPRIILQSPEDPRAVSNRAEHPAIAVDATGKAQVVWSAGDIGTIFHSSAYARDFRSAQSWSEPQPLPAPAPNGSRPDIVADPLTSDLFVVYTIPYNEHRGVYLIQSPDAGTSWLTPTLVFDAAAAGWDSVDRARLALDPVANVLHLTWLHMAYPGNSAPQEVYYARSSDRGQTWSAPVQVASGAVDWPRIAVLNDGGVYLAWNVAAEVSDRTTPTPYEGWGQVSRDGGRQWSNPSAIPGFRKISGPLDLFANAAGLLHIAAMAEETDSQSVLLLARWADNNWRDLERVELGQEPTAGNAAALGLAPQTDRLNVLMRLYSWGQNNAGKFELAVTSRNVTPVVVAPLPTFTPLPTATTPPTPTPLPTATLRPRLPETTQQPVTGSSGIPPLLLGGILAAAIVVGTFALTTIRRRR